MSKEISQKSICIVLIGIGASNVFVLSRFVKSVLHRCEYKRQEVDFYKNIKIVLVDKSMNFGRGVAYGENHALFLCNTPVKMLEPKREFQEWLEDYRDYIPERIESRIDSEHKAWFKDFLIKLKNSDITEVNLPRIIYGDFLISVLQDSIYLASKINKEYSLNLEISVFEAEVCEILKSGGKYKINLNNPKAIAVSPELIKNKFEDYKLEIVDGCIEKLTADVISLGIGISKTTHAHLDGKSGYFSNIYESGIDAVRDYIQSHPSSIVNIALLGSKSSALDFIYYIKNTESLKRKVRICVVSSSGKTRYPAQLSNKVNRYLPRLVHEKALFISTSEELVKCIEEEIKIGMDEGYTRLEVWRGILRGGYYEIIRKGLSDYQKFILDRVGSKKIREMTSFTDADQIYAFDSLLKEEILNIKQAKVGKIDFCEQRESKFYIYSEGRFLESSDVVINCMGPSSLQSSADPLIKSLIHQRLVKVNVSEKGFQVNAKREASKNLFVVGPLTSGNEIFGRDGKSKYSAERHTLPYVLEDSSLVGKLIADYTLMPEHEEEDHDR